MRLLLAVSAITVLTVLPVSAQNAGTTRSASTPVFLLAGAPSPGAQVVAVTQLSAPATADQDAATYAALRVRTYGFVFRIARVATAGEPVGATQVHVNGGTSTLFQVATQLHAALSGSLDLVVFTAGSPGAGVVLSLVPLAAPRPRTVNAPAGATRAIMFADGREIALSLGAKGQAGPTLVLDDAHDVGGEGRFTEGSGYMR